MIRDNQEKGSEGGDYSEAYRNDSTIKGILETEYFTKYVLTEHLPFNAYLSGI